MEQREDFIVEHRPVPFVAKAPRLRPDTCSQNTVPLDAQEVVREDMVPSQTTSSNFLRNIRIGYRCQWPRWLYLLRICFYGAAHWAFGCSDQGQGSPSFEWCRCVPSASLNTNDFRKLWRVNMQDHKGMEDLLWIDNSRVEYRWRNLTCFFTMGSPPD